MTPWQLKIALEAEAENTKARLRRDRHQAWCIGVLAQTTKFPSYLEWMGEQEQISPQEKVKATLRVHNEQWKSKQKEKDHGD